MKGREDAEDKGVPVPVLLLGFSKNRAQRSEPSASDGSQGPTGLSCTWTGSHVLTGGAS